MPAKHSLKLCNEVANKFDGECISKEYKNSYTPLLWRCKENHVFKKQFRIILEQESWCPECKKIDKASTLDKRLTVVAKHALEHDGYLLTEKVNKGDDRIKLRCKFNHVWDTPLITIFRQKTWCPMCASFDRKANVRQGIEYMKKIAKEKKGKCLSKVYVNAHEKLEWQCSKGHRWHTPYINIRDGKWCPECAGNRKNTIIDMIDLAAKFGGQFCSDEYKGNKIKHEWECSCGNKWMSTPEYVKRGNWCKVCKKNLIF